MSTALLFAGQGAQCVGMGKDLYERFSAFRAAFDNAAQAVDFDLKKLCFEGPDELLGQTQYTQPCMVAFAIGVLAVLQAQGISFNAAAGLSLGEYSALCAAGVLAPQQAVQLVALRGKAMAQAAQGRTCKMAAVLGLSRDTLVQVCRQAAVHGVVEIANYNAPGQMVIAGEQAAVDAACEGAKQAGCLRCVPLRVSGPFHTSLMKPAGDALAQHFQQASFAPMQVPVYFNCLGAPMSADDSIATLLIRQVQSSVYFEDTLTHMHADGITNFIEIGPGKVLAGFVKRTVRGAGIISIQTADELCALFNKKGASV